MAEVELVCSAKKKDMHANSHHYTYLWTISKITEIL